MGTKYVNFSPKFPKRDIFSSKFCIFGRKFSDRLTSPHYDATGLVVVVAAVAANVVVVVVVATEL